MERRGRIRARVGDQACVYTKTASDAEGGKRVKLMYLFCGHPHMLLAREGSLLSREGLMRQGEWSRRRGPAPRRISAQRYCFCVQRTSVSLPFFLLISPRPRATFTLHPFPPCRFFTLLVSSRRVYAPISRLPTFSLRFGLGRELNTLHLDAREFVRK